MLNSTLLAQLASNRTVSRFQQPQVWYERFLQILGQFGRMVQPQGWSMSTISTRMDRAALGDLEGAVPQDQLAALKAALASLEALPLADPRVALFNHQGLVIEGGNFQLIPCSMASGAPTMTIGGFYFFTGQPINRFPWAAPSGIDLFYMPVPATLNLEIYAVIRNAVRAKLGTRTLTDVVAIPNG